MELAPNERLTPETEHAFGGLLRELYEEGELIKGLAAEHGYSIQ